MLKLNINSKFKMKAKRRNKKNLSISVILLSILAKIAFGITVDNWSFLPNSFTVSTKQTIDFSFTLSAAPQNGHCIYVKIDPIYSTVGKSAFQLNIINNYRPFLASSPGPGTSCIVGNTDIGLDCSLTADSFELAIRITKNNLNTQNIVGKIVNFNNPFSVTSTRPKFFYSSTCSGAQDGGTAMKTGDFMSFTLGTLKDAAFTSNSSIVGSTGNQLIVSFTPGSALPLEGIISIKLPKRYTNQANNDVSDFLPDTTSLTIGDASGQGYFQSFSVISNNIMSGPARQEIDIRYFLDPSNGGYAYDNTKTLKFFIQDLTNPISGVPVTGFTLKTYDYDGKQVDTNGGDYSFSGVNQFGIMDSASVKIIDSVYGVNPLAIPTSMISFTFRAAFQLEEGCYIRFKFPKDVKIDVMSSVTGYSASGIAQKPPIRPDNQFDEKLPYVETTSTSFDHNELTIEGCGEQNALGGNFEGIVNITSVLSPGQFKTTDRFEIFIYKDSSKNYVIASSSNIASGLQIQSTDMQNSFSINDMLIKPISDNQTAARTDLNISFSIGTNLYYDSQIVIDLPTKVFGYSPTCSVTAWSTTVTGFPTCYFTGTNNKQLVIQNIFSQPPLPNLWATNINTNAPVPLKLWFQIFEVTNPDSTRPGGSWKITTQNKISSTAYADVEYGSNPDSYQCVVGSITAYQSLTVVGDTTTKSATYYEFKINLGHSILTSPLYGNGMIEMLFPSDFTLDSSLSCYSGCNGLQIQRSSSNNKLVQVRLSSSIQVINNPLTLTIQGIQNPRSKKPTQEIKITSYDSQSAPFFKIDEGSGFSTVMSKLAIFESVNLQYFSATSNKTNGGQTKLNVKITMSSDQVRGGDTFFFTLPPELTINPIGSNFSCSSATCTRSGNAIQAKMPGNNLAALGKSYDFQINGVINPINTRVTQKMTQMYLQDFENYNVSEFSTGSTGTLTIQSGEAAFIQKSSLYQDNLSLGQAATYRIEFITRGKISKDGSILITWPPQVTITDKSKVFVMSNGKIQVTPDWQVSNRQLIIKNAFANQAEGFFGSIQVEITPVVNPRDNRIVGSFSIFTYDDPDQKVAIDKLPEGYLIPKLDCNYPCKSCLGSDRDYCISCWQDSELSYLQNAGATQTCLAQCSSGFTTNGDKTSKICIKCDATCKTCLDSDRTKCVTCADNSKYFYPDTRKCLSQCEAGYFEGSTKFQCSPCSAPCQKCAETATTCTDCFKDSKLPFLKDKTCISQCPPGFAGVEQACLPCQSPCATCFNSTSQCLSCDTKTALKFFFGFQCLSSCPENTVADTYKMICKGCLTGCKRCDEKNQTKCLECQTPFVLFNSQCLADCPSGYKRTANKMGCEPSDIQDLNLIYFPHIIAGFLLAVLAIGGYFKDRKSIIVSNIIVLLGPIELLSYIVQLGLSLIFSTIVVTGATGLAILSYIVINCIVVARFNKLVAQADQQYKDNIQHYEKTQKFILFVSKFFSFKMIRLNYSFLYGFDIFKMEMSNPEVLRSIIRNYSILHGIFSSLVIIAVDVVILLQEFGIMQLPLPKGSIISLNSSEKEGRILSVLSEISTKYKIDSQMKIVMIETLILSLIMVLLTIYEFFKLRRYMSNDYNKIQDDTMAFASLEEEKNDKKLRREMLKKIMQQVKGSQDLFNEGLNVHKADDLVHAYGRRRCRSMTLDGDLREGDPRQVKSEPPSPKKEWGGDDQGNRLNFQDNVYADSQPANPLGKIGKTYTDAENQVNPDEFAKILSRKGGDFLQFDEQDKNYRRTRDKNKKRGRKNQYYHQIDAEDDQEVDHLNESAYLSAGGEKNLGIIREEALEDEKKKSKKPPSPKKQQAVDNDKPRKEAEEAARRLKQQQEQEANQKQESELKRSPTFGKFCEDPKVQVPPDQNKRTFNEHDILGDFDRDEKGNIIILQDALGNYIDKQGRRVNERGYLIDPSSGDIIENQQKQTMFPKKDLDDKGEIPAPFCVEKYNFNPFKIRGEFNLDKNRNPIINKNRNGDKVDKYNRVVNSKGWLVDRKGNIVDLMGVKKFDQRQLNPDNGDLPRLFNYQGKRFDVLDICGAFDLNPHNGEIVLKKNGQGQFFDNFGRLVNQRGYLIDFNGNIVDKDGKRIFDKKQISTNGEIPKIFPFTKFNINNILGDFEMDPAGNPILEKRSDGYYYDRQGRRVNGRGYFIDEFGNIVDKKGMLMFSKDILDSDGEIPEIFRSGLLKSDSASSLSRLMSEIERTQPEEMYRNPQKKKINQNSGGETSFDSAMDDTPSNYNHANQRIDRNRVRGSRIAQIDEEDASIISGVDEDGMPRKRKKGKKRRKKVVQEYNEPSDKDYQMAKAYGGVAKGSIKRQIPKGMNARGVNSPKSQLSQQKKLSQIAGSVSGLRKNQATIRADLEESKSRLNQNQSMAVLNETNDPSVMAVPEHHLREERLKMQKLKEAKLRGKLKKKNGALAGPGDPDFERMFGKDIDEFLEDSDWDVESFDNMSQYSRGTAKSAFLDGRIRGLESIYLQRLESGMKKGSKSKGKSTKPKFRVLQDRFVDDPSYMHEGAVDVGHNEGSSQVSQQRRVINSHSAMGQYGVRNMSVTAQTQFLPGSQNQIRNNL